MRLAWQIISVWRPLFQITLFLGTVKMSKLLSCVASLISLWRLALAQQSFKFVNPEISWLELKGFASYLRKWRDRETYTVTVLTTHRLAYLCRQCMLV